VSGNALSAPGTARAISSDRRRLRGRPRALLVGAALGAITGCADLPNLTMVDESRLASERHHLARFALDS